jgi:hypothetical protein
MKANMLRDLTTSIHSEEVLAPMHELKDEILNKNLRSGCEALNKTRQFIRKSNTHPKMNEYNSQEIQLLNRSIKILRDTIRNISSKPLALNQKLDAIEDEIKNTGCGNCGEYCYLVYNYCLKNNIPAEVFRIENGGHAFVVIGRSVDSNPADHTTWGNQAVVCDAWLGNVFQAVEIPEKLFCHTYSNDLDERNKLVPFTTNDYRLNLVDNIFQLGIEKKPQSIISSTKQMYDNFQINPSKISNNIFDDKNEKDVGQEDFYNRATSSNNHNSVQIKKRKYNKLSEELEVAPANKVIKPHR